MTIAFVQNKVGTEVSGGSSIVESFTSSVTANNLIIAAINIFGGDVGSVADNKGNTWHFASQIDDSGNSGGVTELWYTIATTGGSSFTVTYTPLSGVVFGFMDIAEFSGINTSSPLDVHVPRTQTMSGGETSLSSDASGTLAQASELVIVTVNFIDGVVDVTATTPTGFSDLGTHANGSTTINADTAYKIVNSTSTITATWPIDSTASSGDTTLSIIASFKAAATAYTLDATSKAYTWSVTAATLRCARKISAATKAYTWSVTAASLIAGRKIVAASKAYTWNATAITIKRTYVAALASRAYIWSATAATLVVTTATIAKNKMLKMGIGIANKLKMGI